MKRETTTVAVRRSRFEPPTTNTLAVNPASPMVLQEMVMQMLADLNRKLDALAARPPQAVTGSPAPSVLKAPVETASPADTTALAKTPTPRINRLRLRDIFD
jgi:outer membrane lipopolysaccharide assembly protein LptE/RlpB